LAFRLALEDGTLLDVSRADPDGAWRLDREDERAPAGGSMPIVSDGASERGS
jgi:hypothetical protein